MSLELVKQSENQTSNVKDEHLQDLQEYKVIHSAMHLQLI